MWFWQTTCHLQFLCVGRFCCSHRPKTSAADMFLWIDRILSMELSRGKNGNEEYRSNQKICMFWQTVQISVLHHTATVSTDKRNKHPKHALPKTSYLYVEAIFFNKLFLLEWKTFIEPFVTLCFAHRPVYWAYTSSKHGDAQYQNVLLSLLLVYAQ